MAAQGSFRGQGLDSALTRLLDGSGRQGAQMQRLSLLGLILSAGLLAAFTLGWGLPHPVLSAAGLALVILPLVVQAVSHLRPGLTDRRLQEVIRTDPAPGFVTDRHGRIVFRNPKALALHAPEGGAEDGDDPAGLLAALMRGHIANPRSAMTRLIARATAEGSARDDLSSRSGTLRLTVHRLRANRFLWRVDDFGAAPATPRGADGLSLPMLTVNRQGVVLFANDAMRRLLGERPRRIETLFKGPPPAMARLWRSMPPQAPSAPAWPRLWDRATGGKSIFCRSRKRPHPMAGRCLTACRWR